MISKMMLESRKTLLGAEAEGMLPVLNFEGYLDANTSNINPALLEFIGLIGTAAPINLKMESKDGDSLVYAWGCWQIVAPKVSLYIRFFETEVFYRLDYEAGHRQTSRDDMLENMDALTQMEFARRRYAVHVHTHSLYIPFEPNDVEEEISKAQNLIDLLVYVLNNFMYRTSSQVKTLEGIKDYIAE